MSRALEPGRRRARLWQVSYSVWRRRLRPWRAAAPYARVTFPSSQETFVGKYILGWILGVPAIVLVIAYFFFH